MENAFRKCTCRSLGSKIGSSNNVFGSHYLWRGARETSSICVEAERECIVFVHLFGDLPSFDLRNSRNEIRFVSADITKCSFADSLFSPFITLLLPFPCAVQLHTCMYVLLIAHHMMDSCALCYIAFLPHIRCLLIRFKLVSEESHN